MGNYLEALTRSAEKINSAFSAKDKARETVIRQCRDVIRHSAYAIRAVHRREYDQARYLINKARDIIADINIENRNNNVDLLYTGPLYDAHKEFAEASITLSLLSTQDLPDPDDMDIGYAAYLNGMGESIGEIRRYILDSIRRDDFTLCDTLLSAMDDIYSVLVTMDFPDAITHSLRRTTDSARGILEKTRSDITVVIKQKELEENIHKMITDIDTD